jgi:hypothetical protein
MHDDPRGPEQLEELTDLHTAITRSLAAYEAELLALPDNHPSAITFRAELDELRAELREVEREHARRALKLGQPPLRSAE